MLILGEFFQTQSDQNVHQNAPYFQKLSLVAYAPAP